MSLPHLNRNVRASMAMQKRYRLPSKVGS